jgi:hypothetical protein
MRGCWAPKLSSNPVSYHDGDVVVTEGQLLLTNGAPVKSTSGKAATMTLVRVILLREPLK